MVEKKTDQTWVDYDKFFASTYPKEIQTKSMSGVIKRLSMYRPNLRIISQIDMYEWYIPHKLKVFLIYYNIHYDKQYIKFIRKSRDEKGEYEDVHELVKEYLRYSTREYEFIKPIIENKIQYDMLFRKWIKSSAGLSDKRLKKLGIEVEYVKMEKLKKVDNVSLSSFFG